MLLADCFWDTGCPSGGYRQTAAPVAAIHSGHSIIPMVTLIVAIAALMLVAALAGYVMSNRKVAR